MEMLQSLYQWFLEATKTNPLLPIVLAPLIYICKSLPSQIYGWFKSRLTVSLTITDELYTGNKEIAHELCTWFMSTRLSKWSRSLQIVRDENWKMQLGPGVGLHFLWFEGALYFLNIREKEGNTGNGSYRYYTITRFGRSHAPIYRMIKNFSREREDTRLQICSYGKDGWYTTARIETLKFDRLSLNTTLRSKFEEQIKFFLDSRDWYVDRALPHKITYLLTGKPGTGKTSIVRSLGYTYNLSVFSLDLSSLNNSMLRIALSNIPPNSILLIEDIDAMTDAVADRSNGSTNASGEDGPGVTLSGLLNALDGVAGLQDVIVFITTNYPERLDGALVRKSRIDYTFEIGDLTHDEIIHYCDQMYKKTPSSELRFADIRPCDLHGHFLDHKFNFDNFIKALPKETK